MRQQAVKETEAKQPKLTKAAEAAKLKEIKAQEDLAALTPRAEIDKRREETKKALADWAGEESWKDKLTGTSQKELAEIFSTVGINASPEAAKNRRFGQSRAASTGPRGG